MSNSMLPLNLSNMYNTYMFIAYPMSILSAYYIYTEWSLDRFINIKSNAEFDFNYAGWAYGLYGEIEQVIDMTRIYTSMLCENFKIDITKALIRQINDNRYAYIMLDEYFLSPQSSYRREHFIHDSLIYGYDDDNSVFYAISINSFMGTVRKVKYSFSDVNSAFCSQVKWNEKFVEDKNEKAISVIWMKPKQINEKYCFSTTDFCNKISDYINSVDNYNDKFYTNTRDYKKDRFNYGQTAISDFCEHIKNLPKFDFQVYRNIHFLYEHKMNMKNKLDTISNNDDFLKKQTIKYEKVFSAYSMARYLTIKKICSQNNAGNVVSTDKIVSYLLPFIDYEKEILKNTREYLIKNRMDINLKV